MAVFSDIVRANASPASYGDSHFQFLDRVSGHYWDQVRDLVEAWFERLCPLAQPDVRGRLRSRDDRQFRGAFLELYLHECLVRMGYSVTCHPQLDGTSRRPDFRADKDGRSIYIEARSTSSSDRKVGSSARVNDLYESIDKIHSPNFYLWIDIEQEGHAPLGARPLRRQLEEWLASLDPDEPAIKARARDELPGFMYDKAGWMIDFRAIAKTPRERGKEGLRPLGVLASETVWARDEENLRSALGEKGSAYGSLGAPFVVAVLSSSPTLDDHAVLNALYGTESVQIRIGTQGTHSQTTIRQPNGYWYADHGWRHRGVSAVLVVKNPYPAFVARQQHTIWEHPQPEYAVDAFPIWRRAAAATAGELSFLEPERSQADWFGLDARWPDGKPFPTEFD